MSRSLRLVAFLILVGFGSRAGLAQEAPQGLENLILSGSGLPEGCVVLTLDDSAPAFLKANPQASDDPEFVRQLGEMTFRGSVPSESVEEALMGVYQAEHEVGMLAFRFENDAAARQAGDVVRANEEVQEILIKGTVLALIWRDGPSDVCFQALTDHVRAAMGLP